MLPADWDWSGAAAAAQLRASSSGAAAAAVGSTEAVRELGELQLAYNSLLGEIIACELLPTLGEGPALEAAMDALARVWLAHALLQLRMPMLKAAACCTCGSSRIDPASHQVLIVRAHGSYITSGAPSNLKRLRLQGGEAHVDVPARKVCVVALGRLVTAFKGRPGFRAFAIDDVGVRCCLRGLCGGSVDVRDGGALGLLNEAAATLVALQSAYRNDFLQACTQYVQRGEEARFEVPWAAVLAAIEGGDATAVKAALKALMRAKQARGPRIKQRSSVMVGEG
jgi:hypothetical protein